MVHRASEAEKNQQHLILKIFLDVDNFQHFKKKWALDKLERQQFSDKKFSNGDPLMLIMQRLPLPLDHVSLGISHLSP
jgi:hypothetical protein